MSDSRLSSLALCVVPHRSTRTLDNFFLFINFLNNFQRLLRSGHFECWYFRLEMIFTFKRRYGDTMYVIYIILYSVIVLIPLANEEKRSKVASRKQNG